MNVQIETRRMLKIQRTKAIERIKLRKRLTDGACKLLDTSRELNLIINLIKQI
jgi:hypothetical protein